MPDPYTNETVELVARIHWTRDGLPPVGFTDSTTRDYSILRPQYLEDAHAVLTALSDAGLLIEPDGKVTWATSDPDFPEVTICCESEEQARRRAEKWPHVKLLRSGTAPWVEVPRG